MLKNFNSIWTFSDAGESNKRENISTMGGFGVGKSFGNRGNLLISYSQNLTDYKVSSLWVHILCLICLESMCLSRNLSWSQGNAFTFFVIV